MSPEDTWRYTADFLYMIEEPVIREAFFPSDLQPYAVEVSTAADHDVIRAITAKHEGPEACAAIDHLLEKIPEVFRVARDAHDSVQGYYLVIDPHAMNAADFADDPLMAGWWQHLQDNPIPKGQSVLFLRRWLGSDKGELPSPEQAACWLDVKGDYIRMRAVLRRVYTTAIDVPTYAPVLTRLGFELVPELEIRLGKDSYHTALLDFGPGLILQWFDDQVRAALEMDEKFLDFSAREVILDSGRVGLTPLEFGVLSYLYDHEGSAISRGDLLNHVWGHNYEGGSNVVDTKVRSLRKKLGPYADTIETVSGVGYRYRNPA